MTSEELLENYKNYVEAMLEMSNSLLLTFDEFVESLIADNKEFIESFGTSLEE